MSLAVLRRAALALSMAAIATPSLAAAPPLLMTFTNQSGRSADDIYVGVVGGDKSQIDATNVATGEKLSASAYKNEHWYKLSALPKGINVNKLIGVRVYVSYGTPWTFQRAGYEPNSGYPADPNYTKRYDKMEMTYTPGKYDVADTTTIDYFSIPMALNVYNGATKVGSVTGNTAQAIVAALKPVGKNTSAIITDPKTKAFIRVVGPGVFPPPPGLPASPYDDFTAYLKYLRDVYAPAHGGVIARIKGHFGGVGENPVTAETKPQDYDFTAAISKSLDITLTGSTTMLGKHTVLLTHADLAVPSGIYGANPLFKLDGAKATHPLNDVYGWMIGDLLSGLNVGAVGSTMTQAGDSVPVGQMDSQQWFKLKAYFGALQPGHKYNYNTWAAAMAPVSQAYNFAYSDRFAHVVAPLNPGDPHHVDRLEIVLLPEK